ncbi:unnamed protein product [Meloidogyne enterolobii]|uniref:Uncharacterized protein n=1 Tax=Meloidogyne enterolobii TaxID=390850 RepID=A0ACB0ZAG5_MELEN
MPDKSIDEQLLAGAFLDLELNLKQEIRQNSAVELAKLAKYHKQKENQLMLIEEKIDRLITNREDGKFAYLKKRLGWNTKTAEFSRQSFQCGKIKDARQYEGRGNSNTERWNEVVLLFFLLCCVHERMLRRMGVSEFSLFYS